MPVNPADENEEFEFRYRYEQEQKARQGRILGQQNDPGQRNISGLTPDQERAELPNIADAPQPGAPLTGHVPPSFTDVNNDFGRQILGPMAQAPAGVIGAADAGLSMLSGGLNSVWAGWKGIWDMYTKDPSTAANNITKNVQAWTHEPVTGVGQDILSGIGSGAKVVDDATKELSWKLGGGNPDYAATAYAILNAAPSLIGAGVQVAPRMAARKAVQSLLDKYNEKGIILGSPNMPAQIADAADLKTTDAIGAIPTSKGQGIPMLQNDLQHAKLGLEGEEELSYETAKKTNAWVLNGDMKPLGDALSKIVDDPSFLPSVRNDPDIQGVMDSLKKISDQNEYNNMLAIQEGKPIMNAERHMVSLNEMEFVRRRIKGIIDDDPNSAIGKMGIRMKMAVKNFMDNTFDADMIQGDDRAVGLWKQAHELTNQYFENFESDSTIWRIATEQNSTPVMWSNWIFGAAQMTDKPAAAMVVRRLKNIFGENSPQINAVRTEYLIDALKPLRPTDGPITMDNIKGFMKFYNNAIADNLDTVKELSPFIASGLQDVYTVAQEAVKAGTPAKFTIVPSKVISRFLVGHAIARHGAMVSASSSLMEATLGKTPLAVRKQIITNLLGYDVSQPLFKQGSRELQTLWAGAVQEAMTPESKDDDQQ